MENKADRLRREAKHRKKLFKKQKKQKQHEKYNW